MAVLRAERAARAAVRLALQVAPATEAAAVRLARRVLQARRVPQARRAPVVLAQTSTPAPTAADSVAFLIQSAGAPTRAAWLKRGRPNPRCLAEARAPQPALLG